MNDSREAMYWSAAENRNVRCGLCPHRCNITENAAGICGVRKNQGGVMIASGYGQISSVALDPIEKKPLYMFHPGKSILSIGGFGCNLRCPFCQNHEISMQVPNFGATPAMPTEGAHVTGSRTAGSRTAYARAPGEIAALAVQTMPDGNIGVAYTYNEPLIDYEFIYDCAKQVRDAGLKNVLVTNGYINKEPLKNLLPMIDAMNIDLKGFSDSFYKKLGGKVEPVKETIALSQKHCHVEVTTLVIPGENEDDIEEIAKWLSKIDQEIPLHLSRFFPRHRYTNKAPTPRDTIYKLQKTANGYLKHVFTGNM